MENGCLITLVQKFRGNDMSVFPVIFAEFEGLLYHYTAKCRAEDTFQELSVFLVELLYKIDISRFSDTKGDGLKRYIAVCLGNKYISISKADSLLRNNTSHFEEFTSPVKDFSQQQALKEALDRLTAKQRQVVTLKYIYNYSDIEIAQCLHISRQAVNKIKNRGVEGLREYLK